MPDEPTARPGVALTWAEVRVLKRAMVHVPPELFALAAAAAVLEIGGDLDAGADVFNSMTAKLAAVDTGDGTVCGSPFVTEVTTTTAPAPRRDM